MTLTIAKIVFCVTTCDPVVNNNKHEVKVFILFMTKTERHYLSKMRRNYSRCVKIAASQVQHFINQEPQPLYILIFMGP